MQTLGLLLFVCFVAHLASGDSDVRRKLDSDNSTLTSDSADDSINPTTPQFESRQGRIGPTLTRVVPSRVPVQVHRSNVNYANGINKDNGAVRTQGPVASTVSKLTAPLQPFEEDNEQPQLPVAPIEVTEIRCLQSSSRELFSATIRTPNGVASAAPVFEDRSAIDPSSSTTCRIAPADRSGQFRMSLSNLDYCGVTTCNREGQPWLCVTLRFPVLAGLKLPEDEIIVVQCKPQDRTVQESKDIGISGAENMRFEPKKPVMFTGGRQEFQCEIGLFRRLPGTTKLQQINSGIAVELGEEVQLKSVVRSNDGWYHSKMTDVMVRRLKRQSDVASEGSATLVLSDGCRNPAYKAIAPQHPERDSSNSLLNSFNFRVFLFQDMEDGDSILISAKVIACVEAIDCAPSLCSDNRSRGYGRRRRRSVSNRTEEAPQSSAQFRNDGTMREILIQQILYPNGTQVPVSPQHPLKGWETDLALRVAMPGENYNSGRNTPLATLESHCFLYLMLTVALATALVIIGVFMIVYCAVNCRRNKDGSQASQVASAVPPQVESLLETCYPELQVLDALSRSVRQKKHQVNQEIIDMYSSSRPSNVYSGEPTTCQDVKTPRTLRQIKRGRVLTPPAPNHQDNISTVTLGSTRPGEEAHYWEIVPPIKV